MKLLFILALCLAIISALRNRTEKPSDIDLKKVEKAKMDKYVEKASKHGSAGLGNVQMMMRKGGFDPTKFKGDGEGME